jgi:hypothetical protein
MAKGAMSRTPNKEGKVYAGGSSNFDESKGRYTSPPKGSERLSFGVYRTPSGQLMAGNGRILQRPEPQASRPVGAGLLNAMQNANQQPLVYQMPQGQSAESIAASIAAGTQPIGQPSAGLSQPAAMPTNIFGMMRMSPEQQRQFAQQQQAGAMMRKPMYYGR